MPFADSAGVLKLPGGAGAADSFYLDSEVLLPDHANQAISIKGASSLASNVRASDSFTLEDTMIDIGGTGVGSTVGPHREIEGFRLYGNDRALYGIDARGSQYLDMENLFIDDMENGSGTSAAGIVVNTAIASRFKDIYIGQGDGHGLHSIGGSNAFFNGNIVLGSTFVGLTGYGINITGGSSGNAYIGNVAEFCDRGMSFSGYSSGGNIIQGYFEDSDDCDIYLGTETHAKNFLLTSSYFNGFVEGGHQDADYSPIKIKFAYDMEVSNNLINQTDLSDSGYYFVDADIAGGNISRTRIHYNNFKAASSGVTANRVYNIPDDWCTSDNSLIDYKYAPLIQANILSELAPYGSWTLGIAGSSAIGRGGEDFMGQPSIMMVRDSGTCLFFQDVPANDLWYNTFMTVCVPVKKLGGSSSSDNKFQLSGDGTATELGSVSLGDETDWQMKYATAYIGEDATRVTIQIQVSVDATYLIGQPCLYQGASPFYEPSSDMFWRRDTDPSNGTWHAGDILYSTTPTSAGKIGRTCITSGTFSSATDSTGDTTISSAIIAGMTDTSDFYIGQFVTTSAGFAGGERIRAITATTLTLSANATSSVNNITVSTTDPTFETWGLID